MMLPPDVTLPRFQDAAAPGPAQIQRGERNYDRIIVDAADAADVSDAGRRRDSIADDFPKQASRHFIYGDHCLRDYCYLVLRYSRSRHRPVLFDRARPASAATPRQLTQPYRLSSPC